MEKPGRGPPPTRQVFTAAYVYGALQRQHATVAASTCLVTVAFQMKPIFDIRSSALYKSMQMGSQKMWMRQADANKLGHAHMIDFFVENAVPLSVRA